MNCVKELDFKFDYMYAKVFADKRLCKEFIEMLENRKVGKIGVVETEKYIASNRQKKSVRLDTYVIADEQAYNIEMQVSKKKNLGPRSNMCLQMSQQIDLQTRFTKE